MKWAISLDIENNLDIQKRLQVLFRHIFNNAKDIHCSIEDLDATGPLGHELTMKLNETEVVGISPEMAVELVNEEGQVFELDMLLKSEDSYRIIVRDGSSIDVLGNGVLLPLTATGYFKPIDISYF
jgi:hypothetical protein